MPEGIVLTLTKAKEFPMPATPKEIHDAATGSWVRYQLNDMPTHVYDKTVFFCNFGSNLYCSWRILPQNSVENEWTETLEEVNGQLMVRGEENIVFYFSPEGRLCMEFIDESDIWYLKRTNVPLGFEI